MSSFVKATGQTMVTAFVSSGYLNTVGRSAAWRRPPNYSVVALDA